MKQAAAIEIEIEIEIERITGGTSQNNRWFVSFKWVATLAGIAKPDDGGKAYQALSSSKDSLLNTMTA